MSGTMEVPVVASRVLNVAEIALGAALTGMIWILIAWPLWDRLLVHHNCNPMVMLPFLVSAAGMLPPCYENMMENLVSGSWSALCSTILAFATLLQFDQVTGANSIVIGLTGTVFLMKSVVNHREKDWFNSRHFIKDALTGTKIAAACGIAALMAWLIPYLDGPTWEKLVIHSLVGLSLVGGILISLLLGRHTRRFGIGVPLAWTVIRIFCSGGIPYFYYWGLYGLLVWAFLNLCSRHGNLWAPSKHWDYWTMVRATSTPWILTISIYVVILAGSGALSVTEGALSGDVLQRQLLSESWNSLNLTKFEEFYLQSLSIPGISRTVHFIYESPVCLINGVLLLGNAGTIYIHEVQGGSISGHVWQAIFFLVVLFSGFYYERTNSEFMLESIKMMDIKWSREAVCFFCLCGIGCAISLWSALNIRDMFSKKMVINMMYLPTFIGTIAIASIIGTRLLDLWPDGDVQFTLPKIPVNESDYDDLVGVPNNWGIVRNMFISAGNPKLVTDLSSMIFTELTIAFGTLVMASFMLVGSIWFPYLGTMMIVVNAILGLWLVTAVISKLVALHRLEFLGTSYELFITVLSVVTVIFLAIGIAFKIRVSIELVKYDWKTCQEMTASYECAKDCNLRDFLINVKQVDIKEAANEEEAFKLIMENEKMKKEWAVEGRDQEDDRVSVDSMADPESTEMTG